MPKIKKIKIKSIKRKVKEITKKADQDEEIFTNNNSLPGKIRVFKRNLDQKIKEIVPNLTLEENRVHLPTINDEETNRPFNYSSRSYSSARGYDTNENYRSNNSDGMRTETNSLVSKREDMNQSTIERNDNLRINHFNNQNDSQNQNNQNYNTPDEPTKKERKN